MKTIGTVTAAVLFALLAISPLPAQEEHRNDAQPPAQDKGQEEAKPAPEHRNAPAKDAKAAEAKKPSHPDAAKPARDERQGDQERHAQPEQQKQAQQQEKQAQQQTHEQPRVAQPDEGRRTQNERPTYAPDQRPAAQSQTAAGPRGGGRIPDDHFRAHFGREHHFRVSRPTIIEGRPRFQYSGYWFEILDPWPAGWSYDDDCYIDYVDDGYYLFDPRYPGVRIAIVVTM